MSLLRPLVSVAAACLLAAAARPTAHVPGCTPTAARTDHAMTWDADRRQVVLFGGEAPGDALSADTWGWTGRAWECVAATSAAGPRPRGAAMLAHDARRHVLVLYGGRAGGRDGLRDTWELGPAGWTLRDTLGPTPDPHGAMAWDEKTGSVLLFHTKGDDGPTRATWRWTGSAWTAVGEGPHEEFPDALLAGSSGQPATLITAKPTGTDDAFEATRYDWRGNRWVPVSATGTLPRFSPQAPAARTATAPRRKGAQLAFDPVRGMAILHGGDDGQRVLDETWGWDGRAWRRVVGK
ncbi:MAG: hypothetical protein HY275_08590 [Gemmatimonadetes bacterium]|nr:hypothetical protein [Gemmatimonadota bacterium]